MDNKSAVEKMISHIKKIQDFIKKLDYDGINLKVVWETITEDLPSLAEELAKARF